MLRNDKLETFDNFRLFQVKNGAKRQLDGVLKRSERTFSIGLICRKSRTQKKSPNRFLPLRRLTDFLGLRSWHCRQPDGQEGIE